MIERKISPHLLEMAGYFPVVTIMGPRQSGKTTLARKIFPNHVYVNLEDKTAREIAMSDPKAFFELYKAPLIVDEVQRVPELLSTIQVLADETRERGCFILTGSHQPKLHAQISQSLAGRTGILHLLPLSIEELSNAGISLSRDEYLFNGFMPRLYDEKIPPTMLYPAYYATYVERDVRQLINVSDQHSFEIFLKLLAGRIGQVVNHSDLAGDIGISATTLSSWLSVLEASYIVFRLPCYFDNFGKRLIKAPKIFFTDVGLAASLLGIENVSQIARDPLLGGLFENMVVMEALKARYNAGKQPELYYFRVQGRNEVDLILNDNRQLTPVEIKAGMTFDPSFAKDLRKFLSFAKDCVNPTVLYSGDTTTTIHGVKFDSFKNTHQLFGS
ncbi:MAG: ATP-binding protein [Lentisphaeria bacterium]|nr:ATP-binding protein [Lentisphaeria bacterium]MDY0175916.1 ATP-binding protein [Lentisphaeria bacterium]